MGTVRRHVLAFVSFHGGHTTSQYRLMSSAWHFGGLLEVLEVLQEANVSSRGNLPQRHVTKFISCCESLKEQLHLICKLSRKT